MFETTPSETFEALVAPMTLNAKPSAHDRYFERLHFVRRTMTEATFERYNGSEVRLNRSEVNENYDIIAPRMEKVR